MRRIILDTDIGTDVDDALALALLLGSPEVELVGVTTVYGDTLLRAQLARRLARLSGRPAAWAAPVVPGRRETLSGRPVWWPGHEGKLHRDLADEDIEHDVDAVDWMVERVREAPRTVDLLAVGPLTNVAAAIGRDPAFARDLRSLVIMGGDFATSGRRAEHNFRCDAVAAETVLSSGARIVVTGLDATTHVRLAAKEVTQIGASGPLGEALVGEIEVFWEFHGEQWNNPHDPVAALTLLEPDLFTFAYEEVRVLTSGNDEGLVQPGPGATARVTVASVPDGDAVARRVVARICAAST